MAAAVLAVVIGVAVTGHLSGAPAPSGSTPPAPAPAADADRAAPGGSAASPVVWDDVAGLSVPVSAVHGPSCGTGERAGCFTRDAAGAALAAVHLLVRTFPVAGSAVFEPTIR